jgi:hypothetical protein
MVEKFKFSPARCCYYSVTSPRSAQQVMTVVFAITIRQLSYTCAHSSLNSEGRLAPPADCRSACRLAGYNNFVQCRIDVQLMALHYEVSVTFLFQKMHVSYGLGPHVLRGLLRTCTQNPSLLEKFSN